MNGAELPVVEEQDLPLVLREVEEGALFFQEREVLAGAIAGTAFALLAGDIILGHVIQPTISSVWPPCEGSGDVLALWLLLGLQIFILAVLKQLCLMYESEKK